MVLIFIGGILTVGGVVACVVPVLPGPLLSYGGLLCLIPTVKSPATSTLVVFGVVTVVATALDYIVPVVGAKKFECSKWGTRGCLVGTISGTFFFPIGLLLGPFLGAFIGELLSGRDVIRSAKAGLGAFLGFLTGLFIKLVACVSMVVCYVRCL